MSINPAAITFSMVADDSKLEQARNIRIAGMGQMTISNKPCPHAGE